MSGSTTSMTMAWHMQPAGMKRISMPVRSLQPFRVPVRGKWFTQLAHWNAQQRPSRQLGISEWFNQVTKGRFRTSASATSEQEKPDAGLVNELQTRLMHAVREEDFGTAAKLRKKLDELGMPVPRPWSELIGNAPWLADRAETLEFLWPTPVQELGVQGILQRREDTAIISETGSGKTLAYLLPILSELDPNRNPVTQVVVIVPSRELGVQVVMLAYRLLGGSVNKGIPGNKDNMFNFKGPRGLRPYGIFDDETAINAALFGRVDGCHIVVGTPRQIQLASPALNISQLRAIVVDEADAMLANEKDVAALDRIFAPLRETKKKEGVQGSKKSRPITVFVGATLVESSVKDCVARKWLREPIFFANPSGGPAVLPKHVQHRMVSSPGWRRLATLARLIRSDLLSRGPDAAPGRTVVFVPTDEDATEVAPKLRGALWGEHMVVVLKPGSEDAQYYLESFRDNKASMLVATQASERGLDLPDVAHVYCLGMPPNAASYIHRAGRAGRIGNEENCTVTTIVNPDQMTPLKMLLASLGVPGEIREDPEDIEASFAAEPIELNQTEESSMRSRLEDMFYLLNTKGEDGDANTSTGRDI
eukprot:gnl/MRDRNA2_/MRDRNA2_140690_c0_seq1.p1 gnl/MRDRNA2_/MRDRNA2_140690_c0~~gnl/MRDRNA2_/MRDRNA2_140690_c0_seq1.p1  ORF type:complete len:613 (-),score=101.96 gnl/MRDRNA2_/MRDRNA2_140690_c0_seq1:189-1964(-)